MTNEKAIERLELLRQKVDEETYRALIMGIKALERERQGHWIRWREDFEYIERGVTESVPHCQCSECKKEYDPHTTQFINFCPNCGADMREQTANETKAK